MWGEIHGQILFVRFQSHFQISDMRWPWKEVGGRWGGGFVSNGTQSSIKVLPKRPSFMATFAFIATSVRNCFSAFYSTKKPFYFAVKCSMYICTSRNPRPSPRGATAHPPNFSGSAAPVRTRSRPLNKRSAVCCEKKLFDSSSCCLRLPNFQPPFDFTHLPPPKSHPV